MSTNSQVMGRMAAQDANSILAQELAASSDADKVAAYSRIIGDLGAPITGAKFVYVRLLKQLQEADLTINFYAYKFFNKKPKIEKYVSQFEGGNTWGDPTYMDTRDEAEEAMFDYSGAKARPGASANLVAVQQRVTQYGQRAGTEFEGAVRPKYAALNYANLKYGSAGQWGKSHMILKEYIKHNASFVHTDSFDLAGSARQRALMRGQVANFVHMQRLIANMPPKMLTALNDAANGASLGEEVQVPGLGSTCYIEAHCHSEIRFDRDIAALVICRNEVDNCEAQTRKLHQKEPDRFKVIKSEKLEKLLEKFANTYGIDLRYV